MENLFETIPIAKDQELYIRTRNDVFKVLSMDSKYNYMAERTEHLYEILPDVWVNDNEIDFEADTNIHNLIDECIYEREYNDKIERWNSPHGKKHDANFETYVVDPKVSVYGAIWVRNIKGMPTLKSVCKFIGFNDVVMRNS